MRRILHIARAELAHLFYSPMAWMLFIGVYLLISLQYMNLAEIYVRQFQNLGVVNQVTYKILLGTKNQGFLNALFYSAFLIIPMITMGVMSREFSGGTIKLLYASPVKVRELVLGKYLALLSMVAFLLCSVFVTYIGMAFSIYQPDWGLMLGSLFGVFLVLATYAAIGLFLSSLTSYQLVAGLSAVGVIYLMGNLNKIEIDNRWFLDITYNLNLDLRAFRLKIGLINSGDISYLLLFIASFLGFTVIRLKTQQVHFPGYKRLAMYGGVAILAIVTGTITTSKHFNWYFDSSREELYSVTKETENLLAAFDKDSLKLTVYSNLFNGYAGWHSVYRQNSLNNWEAWPMFIRYRPDVKVEYVYYYGYGADTAHFLNRIYRGKYPGEDMDQIARLEAKKAKTSFERFLNPDEVKKLSDVESENWSTYYELTYKGDTSRFYWLKTGKTYPEENNIAAALKKLLYGPTRIGFLTDGIATQPYEVGARSFGSIAVNKEMGMTWVNNGYQVDTLSLEFDESKLEAYDVLCLMDVRTPIQDTLMQRLLRYIDRGGNLYLGVNPDRQELVKPLLDKIGVAAKPGVVLQDNGKDRPVYKVFVSLTPTSDFNVHFMEDKYWRQLVYGDQFVDVGFSEACALEYREVDGFRGKPLAVASAKNSWSKVFVNNEDSLRFASLVREPSDTEEFILSLKLTRERYGKTQRIVVVGDGEFMSRKHVTRGFDNPPEVMNSNFIDGMLSAFGDYKYPAIGVRPRPQDIRMNYTRDSIKLHKVGILYIAPILIALLGALLLFKRKRR